jgi:predicted RND superfamily exporter protein
MQRGPRQRHHQRFRLLIIYCLILAPWIGWGAMQALRPAVNSPLDWVDSSFAPRREYDQFCDRFGAGDSVVISWPGCTVDEQAVDDFVRSLQLASGFSRDGQWLFRRVVSGRETYQSLCRALGPHASDLARSQLSGTLLGPDGKTTCIVIFFSPEGLQLRSQLVPLIRQAAMKFGKAEYQTQHLVGPIMDGYTVDRFSQLSMRRFAPLSAIVVICVCFLVLKSFLATALVFGLACAGQAISLAVIHYSGGSMTALLIVIPPLVQVLAISGGVHFVNYYQAALTRGPGADAASEALRRGAVPCILSAATTVIGLGSLVASGLSSVREFGVYAAIGVSVNVILLLAVLPGLLRLTTPEKAKREQVNEDNGWIRFARFQQRYSIAICLTSALLMLGLGVGMSRVRASVRIETLFAGENRLIQDYRWMEQHVGAMVPVDAVVHFDRTCSLDAAERVTLLRHVKQQLSAAASVRALTSCLGPFALQRDPTDPVIAALALEQLKPAMRQSEYFAEDESGESWRTTAYVSAIEPISYGDLLRELQRSLTDEFVPLLDRQGVEVQVTGLMPLVHGIQSQLLDDLFVSFVTAFLLIALVMTIAQAGLMSGLLSMVPNVFPILVLFGLLGWLNAPVDIGSIMTASVALGIAVDDTLHFLSVFQHRLDRGESRETAVAGAYGECGRAMMQTTLICGLGLSMFAFSDFVPTARFAWMMVALLALALLGDLVVLPALLLSPLGKWFELETRMPDNTDAWSRLDREHAIGGRTKRSSPTVGLVDSSTPQRVRRRLISLTRNALAAVVLGTPQRVSGGCSR